MTEETKTSKNDAGTKTAAVEGGDAAVQKRGFTMKRDWRSVTVFILAAAAVLMGLFGPVGSGWGIWKWQSGIQAVFYSPFPALLAILLGIFFIWRGSKKGQPRRPLLWLATAVAALYLGWIGNLYLKASSVPAIHDISTDLADPPQFQTLKLRADNLDNIPGAEEDEMRGLNPTQRWVLLSQKAYGDIRSVRINEPVSIVMDKANRLAQDRGWTIASFVPAEGRLEATATTALFRFKDDVVLRVRPAEDGAASIVDMRSVSRVGQSDLGVNAERVRKFLADLSGTVTAS